MDNTNKIKPSRAPTTFSDLPTEVRLQIFEELVEASDLQSLLHVDRRTRSEAASLLPFETVTPPNPKGDDKTEVEKIPMEELVMVVDDVCSETYWLKFEAAIIQTAGHTKRLCWTIRDMDSLLLLPVLRSYPAKVVIEFRAPDRSYGLDSLLTMRAKLQDVLHIRTLVRRYCSWTPVHPKMEVRFRESAVESVTERKLSFWLNRPRKHNKNSGRDSWGPWPGEEVHIHKYNSGAFFYEQMLIPVMDDALWRSATVVFEREIPNATSLLPRLLYGKCPLHTGVPGNTPLGPWVAGNGNGNGGSVQHVGIPTNTTNLTHLTESVWGVSSPFDFFLMTVWNAWHPTAHPNVGQRVAEQQEQRREAFATSSQRDGQRGCLCATNRFAFLKNQAKALFCLNLVASVSCGGDLENLRGYLRRAYKRTSRRSPFFRETAYSCEAELEMLSVYTALAWWDGKAIAFEDRHAWYDTYHEEYNRRTRID
ncbi:hypothetical protein QBC35DRAFT_531488 [Podospora australis]|uniref:Uncharacterized protein n=1 Tax=Podospora australis TaxID=1536484 RepID=A0AAN7AJU1_9PEZI|nr:hypothetical protein QBC35DRAFT_531488 [Podospora australis]